MKLLNAIIAAGVTLAGCAPEHHVHISAAIDRYDHNRTTMLSSSLLNGAKPFRLTEATYTPAGHELLRDIRILRTESVGADQIPDVLLVPVFAGVRLPLSAEKRSAESSDYTDLIDYLSGGAGTRAGVSIPSMTGDLRATEQQFAEVLRFLGDPQAVCRDQASLLAWAEEHGLPSTLNVTDARYALSAFQSVVAVWHGGFWFVLYQLPDGDSTSRCDLYTRLVVVPDARRHQDQVEKRPDRTSS